MDALTGATTFSTIVGLLTAFQQGRTMPSRADLSDFLTWLRQHSFPEIAEGIEQNNKTAVSIKALLGRQHTDVMEAIGRIDEQLTELAMKIPALAELAKVHAKRGSLSDQALSIITQLICSGAESIMETPSRAELVLIGSTAEWKNNTIQIDDWRFVEDDIGELIRQEFLIPSPTPKGTRRYKPTRSAIALVNRRKDS